MSPAATAPNAPAGVLRDQGNGHYALEGAATMATVTALRSAGLRAFGHGKAAIEVDLGKLARVDSGALALLIDWLAWARAAKRALKFIAPPESLLALARLSDVEELLFGTHGSAN